MAGTVFLTGATGFIGRSFVRALAHADVDAITCLVRDSPGSGTALPTGDSVRVARGSLEDVDTYASALQGSDLVVHLAARTGAARRHEYAAVNVDATQRLVDCCTALGVPRLLFVSTIAVAYPHRATYHYASSKEKAEEIVRSSGLNYAIVRPTIVLGPDSPAWKRFVGIARAPVSVIPGTGTVRIQPIYVADLVRYLVLLSAGSRLPDRTFELGGPEVLTLDTFIGRLRRRYRDGPARVVHLPVRPVIAVLSALERLLPIRLPVTAGQFYAFVNDSTATVDPSLARQCGRLKSVDDILDLLTGTPERP